MTEPLQTTTSRGTELDLKPFPSYHNNNNDTDDDNDDSSNDLKERESRTRTRTNSLKILQNEPYKDHRRRRSSSIISHVEPETFEDENDQKGVLNMNANWVDQRGAWLIHFVIIALLKIFFNLLPGITPIWSWTLTNTTYIVGFYIMFHLIKGTPFDFNGGAFDNLTMWEQIDDETLYTPTRKFLIILPIILLLVSNHYAHFTYKLFIFNSLIVLLIGVVPKLPLTHRLRISIPGITGRAQIS
ncbi:similar to Saccharomyces cerevisiae YGR038W ORM1 Evolutionarily conserved protein, similar to Orm2p, required for resistance to agents that induce unfolded protein response [Maudiozyma saulgeensis]|uniref:Similar to Saccharomyces cerevisiae YGR038W ORM1 Evolutionarily conserved protein, similar to Orm2p, required for resistance to agents that induce unfolded protein response n=1 Tax=Maudiozyma saulgeensis TaxID=1789683 RepID=A0A1X7RA00_9SACH|nr:similar to Saccharomyces cerevisiae YGR038W ORM1 Evolutionarily conserved protein, similar to Orm2p, required for resistance to agents that induce unfolded protein response [Kazachstania saulgeensis]